MSKSIQQLAGQLIIAGFRGKTVNENSDIIKYIKDYNLAGVIFYDMDLEFGKGELIPGSRNIESPKQVKKLVKDLQKFSKHPLLISIDQEGGDASRLKSIYGFEKNPSWNHIGMLNNSLITEQFSNTMASMLSHVGVNLNFAPVLDLDFGKGTVISDSNRAFSADPKIVINNAKIFINAHKNFGVIACGKHFPGLGSASGDTHEGFTDISGKWTVKDLLPFDELIQSEDLDTIMISHAFDKKLDPDYPASLSKIITTDILKEDLGFDGVIICDDPSMRAISDHYSLEETFELMLNAGIDLFCLGNNLIYDEDYIPKAIDTICNLIDSGKVKQKRIEESADKINRLKIQYKICD